MLVRFNIIGAGRLGKNLALALMSHCENELVAICNLRLNNAITTVAELGSGIAVEKLADLPAVDITFITSPDHCIAGIAAQLTMSEGIVVHCSGALSSDVLAPLKKQGCSIASIHPLKAFRKNNLQSNALQDCDCVTEGDTLAVQQLTKLFTQAEARVIPIQADKKSTYHAAAVMASNYMVTLASCAVDLLLESGLSEEQAKNMTQALMDSSLKNLRDTPHIADALTGPLARGDVNTINQHLHAIKTPHIDTLYRAAGLATLPLTHLDEEVLHALKERLHEH